MHYIILVLLTKQKIADEANKFKGKDSKAQIHIVKGLMQKIIPILGKYQAFGTFHKKKVKKTHMSTHELIQVRTPYPTLVIPKGKDKSVNHAICVINDLIFDSTQHLALKLSHSTLDWVCGEKEYDSKEKVRCEDVYGALHFNGTYMKMPLAFNRKMKKLEK